MQKVNQPHEGAAKLSRSATDHMPASSCVEQLREDGVVSARLYGENPSDGVGGCGAFFLLLDDPEVYGLPPDPVVPTRRLPEIWGAAVLAGAALAAGVAAAVIGGRR